MGVIAYNLGNLLRRLALPLAIQSWPLTSLQQRLFKSGGRLIRHARYFILQLAQSYLTPHLFGQILPKSGIGRTYIGALVITCLTGLPIFRHGPIGPPHVLGVLTLVTLAVAAVAAKTRMFGRFSAYVQTISYSVTVLLLAISTVTETLTRLPPNAPVVASPGAPIFTPLYLGLLVLFLIGVTFQIRGPRAAARA